MLFRSQASAPVVMQMGEGGELVPVAEASVTEIAVEEPQAPVAAEVEEEPAAQD